jgi:hypothetical protein
MDYFFAATKNAHSQTTRLFDFVWPTATAMWNLRWQVAGYLKILPDSTDAQLKARFTEGASIHGANLKRACIDHTWEEQKESFARILLTNAIAIYEGWIDDVLDDLARNTKVLQKRFQYPEPIGGGGVRTAINEITLIESALLKNSFYASLCRKRHYALGHLDALMLCYRFFKELRNCDMHRGGIADQRLVDAYTAFSAVATCADLGVSEVPIHNPVAVGTQVRASLRGVVGFSSVILKLMATIDAELSRSQDAERAFCNRWKITHTKTIQLPNDAGRRNSKVKRLIVAAGFPRPRHPADFGDWLKNHGLVSF